MSELEVVAFLKEASEYFSKRDTGGEDRVFWANVYNAENCLKAAEALTSAQAEIATLKQAVDAFADICDELGCERDNEAGLQAAHTLKAERDALIAGIEKQRRNFAGLQAVQDALDLIDQPLEPKND